MWPNENSSKEEILDYIKRYPYYFLSNYSDEPWAQPYIDEVAREVAKRYPEFFLENLADRFPHHINLALFAL